MTAVLEAKPVAPSSAPPPAPSARARPRPPLLLSFVSVASAAVFALPAVYVVGRTIGLDADLGEVFQDSMAPLWRTIQLAALVSVSATVLGTAMAWLVIRTDLPGRRIWRILAPLPLVFPSFVGAAAFLAALAPDGLFRSALEAVGLSAPDRFRGLGASWLVLTLFTYPYVYLPVAARLVGIGSSLEDAARSLGDRPRVAFRRVVLPQLGGSMLAGTLLVALYTVSEFGAVQLLAYDTLTRVIEANRIFDQPRSFAAATILLVLALVVVVLERLVRRRVPETGRVGDRPATPLPLGRWRWPSLAGVLLVLVLALIGPFAALAQWAWRGIARADQAGAQLGEDLGELLTPAWNSAWISTLTAVVAVLVVLPVAHLTARYRSRVAGPVNAAVVGGFAVPGLVIALSIVVLTLNTPALDVFYLTIPALVLAYLVHFGSQAMRAAEVAVASVPDRQRESSRMLGAGSVRRMVTVELPLMRPGLLAGGGLVLLSTIKELPATLLLAPFGFRTLTTQIWQSYTDGYLADVGLASVVLVLVSGALTWVLVLRRSDALS